MTTIDTNSGVETSDFVTARDREMHSIRNVTFTSTFSPINHLLTPYTYPVPRKKHAKVKFIFLGLNKHHFLKSYQDTTYILGHNPDFSNLVKSQLHLCFVKCKRGPSQAQVTDCQF